MVSRLPFESLQIGGHTPVRGVTSAMLPSLCAAGVLGTLEGTLCKGRGG